MIFIPFLTHVSILYDLTIPENIFGENEVRTLARNGFS